MSWISAALVFSALINILANFIWDGWDRKRDDLADLKLKANQSFSRSSIVAYIPATELMQVFLSIVLMSASLYIILSKQYDASDKHWAYGTLGTLVGYWLRPNRASPQRKKPKSALP